jgi:hypothetical protein
MLWRKKRLLGCNLSMIALLVKGFCKRTLVDEDSKLVGNLFEWLEPLLVRGCSMRD